MVVVYLHGDDEVTRETTTLPVRTMASPYSSPALTGVTPRTPQVPFGRAMREKHFLFRPGYTPLNHGSYGAYPKSVRDAHYALKAEAEECPDSFIALEWADRLAEQRAVAAKLLNAPSVDGIVFVPNATMGTDTVLKNLVWERGKDVIVVYEVVYDSVSQGLQWLVDYYGVRVEVVKVGFPVKDEVLVEKMVEAVKAVNEKGKENGERVRLSIIDTIVSMPGIRIPFEKLVPALQAEGCLVHVDGAHGIGHIDIDLAKVDADFFVTNLHKWCFVPRGAAVLHVPERNQKLIRTSLPTSHLYRGAPPNGGAEDENSNSFVEMFDFTGTADTTNYLCVKAALDFRSKVCGGEAAIQSYCRSVARDGAEAVAQILATDIMDCEGSCIRDCNLQNVRLPLAVLSSSSEISDGNGKIDPKTAAQLIQWFKKTGVAESGFYFQVCFYGGVLWWRLSGIIYVDVDDFKRGAEVLKTLCERASKGEYLDKLVASDVGSSRPGVAR
ncbi:putative aminotransferase family protein [Xylariaceae sp. FL0255]|nr:putative aminotransferase family protein [Xylariaceae sp. FL0255]